MQGLRVPSDSFRQEGRHDDSRLPHAAKARLRIQPDGLPIGACALGHPGSRHSRRSRGESMRSPICTIGQRAIGTLALLAAPAAAIDLSGHYVGTAGLGPLDVQVEQHGTVVTSIGTLTVGPLRFELTTTGTVDSATGTFSGTGESSPPLGTCQAFTIEGT